jgi:hypothetical protein
VVRVALTPQILLLGESSIVTGNETRMIPLTVHDIFKKINELKASQFFLR